MIREWLDIWYVSRLTESYRAPIRLGGRGGQMTDLFHPTHNDEQAAHKLDATSYLPTHFLQLFIKTLPWLCLEQVMVSID